ncbi:MAG TPA: ROK family protein [Phycisphaerae bacterium]|nr:ROK family protein [Phycisphaerae bacterium]
MPHYLGLDLGGTNVKAGVTDAAGRLLAHVSLPTAAEHVRGRAALSANNVIARMIDAGNQAIAAANLAPADIAAVGILSPGQASLSRGIIFRAANLPLWRSVRLRAKVSKGLNLPAILENDANAAAYGEWWVGAGKNKKIGNLFMFTLGTGVGGGIVYNGKVIRGHSDFAAEIGHTIVIPDGEPCGCGQRGCLETYTSAAYTGRRATHELERSRKLRKKSSLSKILKSAGAVTAADVVAHAKKGDTFALHIWDDTCRILALACINVCHILDPEMIVLAGGMSQAGKFLLDAVQRHFNENWWKMTPPTTKIALAKLGNDAGVIGAAGVAKNAADHHALPPIGK